MLSVARISLSYSQSWPSRTALIKKLISFVLEDVLLSRQPSSTCMKGQHINSNLGYVILPSPDSMQTAQHSSMARPVRDRGRRHLCQIFLN